MPIQFPQGHAVVERAMPSNVEAEQSVLGAILLEPQSINTVFLIVDEFYLEKHRWIYSAMRSVKVSDVITVSAKLQEMGRLDAVGGVSYLTLLLGSVPTASRIAEYAEIVHREFVKRRILDATTRAAEIVYAADGIETRDLVPRAQSYFMGLETTIGDGPRDTRDDAADLIAEINTDEVEPDAEPIETGLNIDRYVRLTPGKLIAVCGDAGSGKTSLGMQVGAYASLRRGKTVLVFSLEMSRKELVRRLASQLTGISNEKIDTKTYSPDERERLVDALSEIGNATFYIDDGLYTSLAIWQRAREWKATGNALDLMVVDYSALLLDPQPRGGEEERTNAIFRNFKLMSRELGCDTLVLHWTNRGGDGLKRMKWGGDFHADVVIFCTRVDGKEFLEIEKNRQGPTTDVPMHYNGSTFTWHNGPRDNVRPFVLGTVPDFRGLPLPNGEK